MKRTCITPLRSTGNHMHACTDKSIHTRIRMVASRDKIRLCTQRYKRGAHMSVYRYRCTQRYKRGAHMSVYRYRCTQRYKRGAHMSVYRYRCAQRYKRGAHMSVYRYRCTHRCMRANAH